MFHRLGLPSPAVQLDGHCAGVLVLEEPKATVTVVFGLDEFDCFGYVCIGRDVCPAQVSSPRRTS